MKTKFAIGFILLATLGAVACKRENPPNKLISALPIDLSSDIAPGQSVQHLILLKRDLLQVVIPVINKMALTNQTFEEITAVANSSWTFQLRNNRYGLADVHIQFLDENEALLAGPASSTDTFKFLDITVVNNSSLFGVKETLRIALDTTGTMSSTKRLSGTSNFSGSGITNLTFTFDPSAPPVAAFEGLTEGTISAAGIDANGPIGVSLRIASDHSVSGTLTWNGTQASISLKDDGVGLLVTETTRHLIN